jgi:hypothetical protein
MADLGVLDCLQPELVMLERVKYFPRQLLTAEDLTADRDYVLQKMRRHNRFLHGWGVVCGLAVTAAPADGAPWRVRISAGYALGPYGDEIHVAEAVFLDLAKCGPGAATDPCEPDVLRSGASATGRELFVAIKYAECLARPVRVTPAGCGCEETDCEYSRIRDSFQVGCLTEPPPSPPPQPTLCELISNAQVFPCPPCPTEPWVVLARVTVPASPSARVADGDIDMTLRRQVFSTAVLQEQLIACCCEERPEPPPPVRTFRVAGMRFLEGTANPADPSTEILRISNPLVVPSVAAGNLLNVIEAEFTLPYDPAAVHEKTFFVDGLSGPFANRRVNAAVARTSATTARWVLREPDFSALPDGEYRVTLVGTTTSPILSSGGVVLDGEARSAFPSGNDSPGGDFRCTFKVFSVIL